MTMYELCAECRNFFTRGIIRGTFRISDGAIEPPSGIQTIQTGQYFRVVGSVFNDGIWQYPASGMTDEEFSGAVWLLAIPPDFIALLDDINAWEAANKDAIASAAAEIIAGPYTSESFAGYTYTKKTSLGDVPTTWKDPRLGFSARLNEWRKI